MVSVKHPLTDLSESEFLSFLYSERERENSLSQYQGWNNWALIGALITVLSVAYASLKSVGRIDWMRCSYYATGSVSFFLAYHSWLKFFKRERGYDFTRVRLLKEMVPWTDSGLSVLTAVFAIALILIYDNPSYLLWIWAVILLIQISIASIAMINRNRLVPSYFYRPFFSKLGWNVAYDGLAGGLFALAWSSSFKLASWNILNSEFEVGICLGTAVVLIYFFIRIKVENKVAEQFDAIIDRYLYTGISKEETLSAILCNRMGYGVMEVCEKELSKVQEMVDACKNKCKELEVLRANIKSDNYDIDQIAIDNRRLLVLLRFLNDALKQSDKLAARLNEMVRIAPILDHVAAIKTVFDTNHELYLQVKEVQKTVDDVSTLLQKEFDEHYCQKAKALCPNMDCEHRDEPFDKKYVRQLRHSHIYIKGKLKRR